MKNAGKCTARSGEDRSIYRRVRPMDIPINGWASGMTPFQNQVEYLKVYAWRKHNRGEKKTSEFP